MGLVQLSSPAVEPLTLEEIKTHLRVDGTNEDTLISSLLLTSRLHIEAGMGLALVTQSWRLTMDVWPACEIVTLPIGPVQAINAIRVADGKGGATVLAPAEYIVDASGQRGRVSHANAAWPRPAQKIAGIEIEFLAGYGNAASDVPQPIRQALLLLVAHWYEHRDPIEIGAPSTAIPTAVNRLLNPYKAVRL